MQHSLSIAVVIAGVMIAAAILFGTREFSPSYAGGWYVTKYRWTVAVRLCETPIRGQTMSACSQVE